MKRSVNDDGFVFDDRVQCYVSSLVYDFSARTGVLHIAEYSCTHMNGAIKMFAAIDPDVERIKIQNSLNVTANIYLRRGDGWYALPGAPFQPT